MEMQNSHRGPRAWKTKGPKEGDKKELQFFLVVCVLFVVYFSSNSLSEVFHLGVKNVYDKLPVKEKKWI